MSQGIPKDFKRYFSVRGSSVIGEDDSDHQPIHLRALLIGAFLSFFLSVAANYADIIIRGSYLSLHFSTTGAILVLLILVGGLNVLFKLTAGRLWIAIGLFLLTATAYATHYAPFDNMLPYSPGVLFSSFMVGALALNIVLVAMGKTLALNRSELIVVYVMLMVVSSLATSLCEALLPAISGMFYYADPTNNWAQTLFPHLPTDLVVNDGNNNRHFYEGFPGPGFDVPWDVWIRPLMVWSVFLLALYMTMICIPVILRRQWVERERLAYPLVQMPQAMIRGESEDAIINPFLRNKAVWIGASLPFAVGTFNGLNNYLGGFPVITTGWYISLPGAQAINMVISFTVMGFSYLISPAIAAGVWGFVLLAKIEKIIFAAYTGPTPDQQVWTVGVSELMSYQGFGALLVFVGSGLWMAREHLGQVFRKALWMKSDLSDDDEIMSYRAAVLGLFGGIVVMVLWFWYLGTPLWAGIVFVTLALVIYFAVTRIVAEAGIAIVLAPLCAPDFMIFGLGSKLLGSTSIANFAFTYPVAADVRVFVMGVVANGLKLIEGMDKKSRRAVFWAIIIAVFMGLIGAAWAILEMTYRGGGINASPWFFLHYPKIVYMTTVTTLEPAGVYWEGMGFVGIGAVAMLIFTWMKSRFLWWPLHPIGFPIMATRVTDQIWFSVMVAWLIKVLVLKYGGTELFRRSRHFFLGMVLGSVGVTGLWLIIDFFTGTVGNYTMREI
jgi:hypothetical protein